MSLNRRSRFAEDSELTSKTHMLEMIKGFSWKEARAALDESPGLLSYRDDRGRNWLHIGCSVKCAGDKPAARRSLKLAEVLIDLGLGVDDAAFTEDEWKATPLWYAIGRSENLELAKYLLDRGADPSNAVFAAMYNRSVDAIRLLVRGGADPNEVHGFAMLPFCATKGRFPLATELLKLGADANFRGGNARTPLHQAVKNGCDAKQLRTLIRFGARGDIPDADGRTVVDILRRKKDPELRQIAEELRRASS
jgi:ankyrin repeat protein